MGITFKHDAAAVVPPSNQSTRKYGQSLVLQQQQQKYAAQQAGYDRMFDAYKMDAQNQVQQQRDWQQRDFVLNRDRDQNKLQQEQMEQQRQQQFMDDARKQSTGMIMDDIQQGAYDNATAMKLKQNLVAESEALGNPQLDATQRAEALQKIRAERATLTANRIEKPPAPTPQDKFDQQIVNRNGVDYIQNSKGGWDMLQQPKPDPAEQKRLQEQEQQAAAMRPVTFEDHYNSGSGKGQFKKDLDTKMAELEDKWLSDNATDPKSKTPKAQTPKPTKEDALAAMRKDYDFEQQALGKPQYGEPTLAPKPYGQTLKDTWDAYVKDKSPENLANYRAAYRSNATLSDLADKAFALPEGSQEKKDAWDLFYAERDKIMLGEPAPVPEMKSILDDDLFGPPAQQSIPSSSPSAPAAPNSSTLTVAPQAAPPSSAPPNNWLDVANPSPAAPAQGLVDMGPAGQPPLVQKTMPPTTTARKQPQPGMVPATPDFKALSGSAKNKTDRAVIDGMSGIYSQQPPQVQSAISVYLDPNSSEQDFTNALRTLLASGIDPQKMQPPMKGHWDAMKDTNKSLSGVR